MIEMKHPDMPDTVVIVMDDTQAAIYEQSGWVRVEQPFDAGDDD